VSAILAGVGGPQGKQINGSRYGSGR
jgi:hypothetical protein